jgi:hypothetical protein
VTGGRVGATTLLLVNHFVVRYLYGHERLERLVEGDPDVLIRTLVREYAWMGWDAEQILGLFRDPFYPALNELLRAYGEAGIRERLAAVLDPMGVFRITGVVRDDPEPVPAEPERIELGIRRQGRPEGSSHAEGV